VILELTFDDETLQFEIDDSLTVVLELGDD